MPSQFEPQLIEFISQEMTQDPAHDLNHVFRVVKTAKRLCDEENAQLEVVLPAAYLHDCFSFAKNHPQRKQSSTIAADKAVEFLRSIHYPRQWLDAIHHAIVTHSFSAGITPQTLEAKIVQDADRLDALGAIGIARCLQVSTSMGAGLYDAQDPWAQQRELDDKRFTIDHFETKLLRLAETMHTASAKTEATKRSDFMREYLEQLYLEI